MNVVINGNLTKDPEIKYFESGAVKAIFSIAVNIYNAKKKDYEPNYYNCEAWNKTAEFIVEKFKKGDKVTLECVYKQETYKSKIGEEKTKDVLTVKEVIYSGAYAVLTGYVEKEETRYTTNNVKIQFFKFKDSPITIQNLNEKIEVTKGNYYTVFGNLIQKEDKKIILNAKNIVVDESGRDTAGEIVKFAEQEFTKDLDSIPF